MAIQTPRSRSLRAVIVVAAATTLAWPATLVSQDVAAPTTHSYVTTVRDARAFILATGGRSAPLYVSARVDPGVVRAIHDLGADLARVTGVASTVAVDTRPTARELVIVGTLGVSPLVDSLVTEGKVDVTGVAGEWEAYVLQVVDRPRPGIDRALVIAGADKRGTIYGVYDLSAAIGVSPWYWWADVPTPHRSDLYVRAGRHAEGPPAVKYRGIFINDEAPALSGWVGERYGTFNHEFYAKLFELILRLKGNFLWPAMWGRSLFDDDSLNAPLANEYGVVISTSHHEPLMRAQVEWQRYGSGPWNYEQNEAALKKFWADGIRRMGSNESIVTVGMRGDGDMPMSRDANIALLERIVHDQRQIIADVTHRDPAETPQVWALYKEVQEYYDKGMRVPDDVTLLFADDNWGNIGRLPNVGAPPRAGGYGVYYHYDYVGGPRNYKWINTNQIARVWEQMHLAFRHGVDRIWIVNVGDIKPMEFPTSFFLAYAWNADRWSEDAVPAFTRAWTAQQFGETFADSIAAILTAYTRYNARRKPELLAPDTYSLIDYREAETVVADYDALVVKAKRISAALPAEYRDAFYELVLHPVEASANLNDLYVTAAKNRLYAAQGRAATNETATRVAELFTRDAAITRYYNDTLAGGKWTHMMDQTHIGYRYWQEPRENAPPQVQQIELPPAADMGVAIEGSSSWWPNDTAEAILPEMDPYQRPSRFIDVFDRGQAPFVFTAVSAQPWVTVTPAKGTVERQVRLDVSVDWAHAPIGTQRVPVTITGPNGRRVVVQAVVQHPAAPRPNTVTGFVEGDGYVSMEAEHFTRAVDAAPVHWVRIPDVGRTASGMTVLPVTSARQTPGGASPRLEYRMHMFDGGEVAVHVYVSPTLDYNAVQGLRYAVSFDDAAPQIVNIHADSSQRAWERWVSDNVIVTVSRHHVGAPGDHVLKIWMVDPAVVIQKIVADMGGLKPSYLGPPESYYRLGDRR